MEIFIILFFSMINIFINGFFIYIFCLFILLYLINLFSCITMVVKILLCNKDNNFMFIVKLITGTH